MSDVDSLVFCFLTTFVCRYDQLDEAHERHCDQIMQLKQSQHEVLFAAENAIDDGHSEPIFDLLLQEIVGFGEPFSQAERERYSTFIFPSVVRGAMLHEDVVRDICSALEIDYAHEFPARFPSRTHPVFMSETGHEIEGCYAE